MKQLISSVRDSMSADARTPMPCWDLPRCNFPEVEESLALLRLPCVSGGGQTSFVQGGEAWVLGGLRGWRFGAWFSLGTVTMLSMRLAFGWFLVSRQRVMIMPEASNQFLLSDCVILWEKLPPESN